MLEVGHRSPLDPDPEWLDYLEALARQAGIAVDNAALFAGLRRSNLELSLAYDATIEGWSRAMDLRDHETEGHSRRVTEMTLRLCRALGMGEDELVHVRRGALLHDIGKIGIPDAILLKPSALTEEERAVIRLHPRYALEMLSPIAFLRPALDIPHRHHERWDGAGYPDGLRGEEIPLAARAFAAVDIWDALRSDRPYRAGWPREHPRAPPVALRDPPGPPSRRDLPGDPRRGADRPVTPDDRLCERVPFFARVTITPSGGGPRSTPTASTSASAASA